MTVFQAIVELTKASWRVLRRHPCLAWFPILSLVTAIGVALLLGPILMPGDGDRPSWLSLLVVAAAAHLVQVFYATALTHESLKALRGETPSVRAGIAAAGGRLPAIASLGAITGTFGFVLAMVGRSRRVAVKIARAAIGTAWSLATYLAIPVMVQERRGGLTSLRRSSDLFRRTWGETTLSEVGLRVLTAQLGLVLVVLAIVLVDLLGEGLGVLLVFAAIIALVAVIGTLEAIYRSALYVFAAEGVIPGPFDGPELDHIWRTKTDV